jgi:hypothetical protein
MTRRTRSISRTDGLTKEQKSRLDGRIKSVKHTIEGLEKLTPALGSKWRDGMLQHYRKVLTELEAYGKRNSKA